MKFEDLDQSRFPGGLTQHVPRWLKRIDMLTMDEGLVSYFTDHLELTIGRVVFIARVELSANQKGALIASFYAGQVIGIYQEGIPGETELTYLIVELGSLARTIVHVLLSIPFASYIERDGYKLDVFEENHFNGVNYSLWGFRMLKRLLLFSIHLVFTSIFC
jgi:hypothetical protein